MMQSLKINYYAKKNTCFIVRVIRNYSVVFCNGFLLSSDLRAVYTPDKCFEYVTNYNHIEKKIVTRKLLEFK